MATNKYLNDSGLTTLWSKIKSYIGDITSNNYISKTNTTSYTPTSNYHPATKKYVDDAITTALSQYEDGDSASYGYADGNEVSY